MPITVYELINIINLILVLIAIIFIYGVLIRTSKNLYKGNLYIFLSIIVFGLFILIEVLYGIQILLSYWYVKVLETLFLLLLVMGFWHLQRCIKEVDGELTHNGKFKKIRK